MSAFLHNLFGKNWLRDLDRRLQTMEDLIQHIIYNQEVLMASLQELTDKVVELQAAVDADQASDAAVVVALQAEIDRLNTELAAGATPEQLAGLVAALEGIRADVAGPNV